MATAQMGTVIRQLRQAVLRHDEAGWTDGQLLTSFIDHKDGAAFEGIVRRHGPMVFGVCRRVARNHHDAEDAFQATFLILARKAQSVIPREGVANWLHGVALRTSMNTRATTAKRRGREKQVTEMPEPKQSQQDQWYDLQPLLDQELNGLPENYRLPILLCDLEGKTIKEATLQLGWPQGTVAGRLSRGRKLLAKRLANRGVALSAGVLGGVISQNAVLAAVPTPLMSFTVKTAAMIVAGQSAVAVVPAKVAILMEGVLKTMLLMKLKNVGVLLLVVLGMLASGGGLFMYQGATAQTKSAERVEERTPLKEPRQKDAQPADELKKDSDALQGKWSVESLIYDGEQVPAETVKAMVILFNGDRMTIKPGLAIDNTEQGTIKLNLDDDPVEVEFKLQGSLPKQMQVTAKLPGEKDKSMTGIYKLTEGKLTLCMGEEPDGKTPGEYSSTKGSKHTLWVLKRLPEEEKNDPPIKKEKDGKDGFKIAPPKATDQRQYTLTTRLVEAGAEPKAVLSPRLTLPDGQSGKVIIDEGPKNLLEKVIRDENIKVGTSFDVRVKRLQGNKARLFFSFAKNEIEKADVSEIRVVGSSVQTIQDVELRKAVKVVFQKDAKGVPQRWVEITVDELTVADEQAVRPPAGKDSRPEPAATKN
jgi:RNA polymerase sigma factor (sigma-70 family)